MAGDYVLEREPRSGKDRRVQTPRVVHDDHDRRVPPKLTRRIREHRCHVGNVTGRRALARPGGSCSDLFVTTVAEAQKLIRVTVLLVVVDEARVRRRRDDSVGPPREPQRPGIVVKDFDGSIGPKLGEGAHPPNRVRGVARQELSRALDGSAHPLVLVAEVRLRRRSAGEVEIEMGRQPCRSGGTGENDLGCVPGRIVEPLGRDFVVAEQLTQRLWRVPILSQSLAPSDRAGPACRASSSAAFRLISSAPSA